MRRRFLTIDGQPGKPGALNSTAEPESVDGGSESRGGSGGYDGSDSGAYSVSEDGAGYDGLDEWRSGSVDCSVSGSRQSEDDAEPAARSGTHRCWLI